MIAFKQTVSLKFSLHPLLDFARKIAGWCFITFQRRGENCQTWGYESQKVFLRQACIPSSSWTLPSSSPPSTGGTKWSCHRGLYFFQLSQLCFPWFCSLWPLEREQGVRRSTLRDVSKNAAVYNIPTDHQEGRASSGGRRKMAAEKKEDSADEKWEKHLFLKHNSDLHHQHIQGGLFISASAFSVPKRKMIQ